MVKYGAGVSKAAADNPWTQAISATTATPTWAQYQTSGTTAVPNVMWQNTSSGATYCAASSVLEP